jgi:hypothetical protein
MNCPPQPLDRKIAVAFPGCSDVPDAFIEANPDIDSVSGSFDPMILVPAYMTWCVRNAREHVTLIPDFTVGALAVYGRTKSAQTVHMSFKHTCSDEQRSVVAEFLRWCLDPDLILHKEQIKRALRHWSPALPKQ